VAPALLIAMDRAARPSESGRSAGRAVRGLYAITPQCADTERLERLVAAALAGGAQVVQYRDKSGDRALRRAQAAALADLCRRHGVPLIVNDDVELALEVQAHGVHLGRDDPDMSAARARLGPGMLIGASCYADAARALAAVRAGADYVAFGSVFASPTKPAAVRAPLSLFARARAELSVPLVAIGGITPANAPEVLAAGADALAVSSALFDVPDVAAAAAALRAAVDAVRPRTG
jgi:thiamine-phosphate pyrophosphorylase